MEIYRGDIVYSESNGQLSVYENSFIAVDKGRVAGIYRELPEMYAQLPVTDYGSRLIIPAFSDLHIHAPQYAQRGTNMDLLLYDWLNGVTFTEESKFSSPEYAAGIYTALVEDMLRNGTFHASVYATLHERTAFILAETMEKAGIRGFVGKVNMDCGSPDYLCETTEQSLLDTERFLSRFSSGARVKPILTPRFAPTCSAELLRGLGRLSAKYGCGMQTHLVESKWEAAEAVRLFPDCSCDAQIYERAGLLENGPVIFGHFIFPTAEDMRIACKYNAVAVHCPDATNNVIAGIMPLAAVAEKGIRIAAGTDVGAGSRMSVYSQIAAAVRLSKLKQFYEPEVSRSISFSEAFCMATRGGGSVFGQYGAFDEGFVFDALVVEIPEAPGESLSPAEKLERFCYNGDDRNIVHRFISGKEI